MAASNNDSTIERFYGAFRALDAPTMRACYARDARFEDPAFRLQGSEQIGAMWQMLCEGARARGPATWRLEFRDVHTSGSRGSAHWEAYYRFGPGAGRPVHNVIDAEFSFDDRGLIVDHRDRFDVWRWSRQSLGLPGVLFGWTPWLQAKVRAQAAARLAAWQARAAR